MGDYNFFVLNNKRRKKVNINRSTSDYWEEKIFQVNKVIEKIIAIS